MGRSLTRFSRFNIDDPNLPPAIKKAALGSGGFPYAHKMTSDACDADLRLLQIELIKLLAWQQQTGTRVITIFEGRDAAGKSGSIKAVRRNLNPRFARIVALSAPTAQEKGQWYFQRYTAELPSAGEMVLF